MTADTRFLYDGWRCIEERNENDSHKLLARYVYGGLYIDEPLRMYRDGNGDGDFADAGDVNVYHLQDRLFNVVALTDTKGAIVERTWYEPYGKPTCRREADGDEIVGSHVGNAELFCGYSMATETGLFHVRNRYYNAAFGRWTERDTVGYLDGMDLYQYASGNPTTRSDPFGHWSTKDHTKLEEGAGKVVWIDLDPPPIIGDDLVILAILNKANTGQDPLAPLAAR